jgi:hypothetical protein
MHDLVPTLTLQAMFLAAQFETTGYRRAHYYLASNLVCMMLSVYFAVTL